MGINYDEYLEENPFFQEIQDSYKQILETAAKEEWIICVPRCGTFVKGNVKQEDVYQHILQQKSSSRFISLNDKEITKTNDILTIKNDLNCYNSIQILFEETFYVENSKFKLWCIECPLTQAFIINDPSDLTNIISIRDCIHLLCIETNGREVLEAINKAVDKFVLNYKNLHLYPINRISKFSEALYKECLSLTIRTERAELQSRLNASPLLNEKINLSVETYMQNCLHSYVFNAICANTSQEDAKLNKTIRNLQELQLKNFTINTAFYDNIPLAKFELSKINNFHTILSKVNCLKTTFNMLSQKENKLSLSADDLLQIFLFLVIKVNVNNWLGNLQYLTQFWFSNLNTSDESSFLICTLEAAIEYIRSGALEKELMPKSEHFYMEFELVGENLKNVNKGRTALETVFRAIHEGNLDEMKKLLVSKMPEKKPKKCHPLCSCDTCEQLNLQERTCTVRSVDDRGRSSLHIACLYGTPEIIEYLINEGADLNAIDSSGSSPLHYAVLRGHQHAVLLLLHAGANINIQDSDGNTPLHSACVNGHENCVKGLIYYSENSVTKIDINRPNRNGNTALHLASRWGYQNIIYVLLEFGSSVFAKNKQGQSPCDIAHNIYLRQVLEKAIVEQQGKKYHHQKEQPHCCQRAKSLVYEYEEKYEIKGGHKFGVRPKNVEESKKCDLLLKAIEKNDLPLTRYYLGMCPADFKNTTNSSSQIKQQQSSCHPLCMCESCSKQTNNEKENTMEPLPELEKLNINMCNVEGYTALHVAAKYGRLEILRLLLDSGALITIETYKTRFSPLHIACFYEHLKVVQELLKCGQANIDVLDGFGNTPLHYAAMAGSNKIVEHLVKHGANINLKNGEHRTPFDVAKEKMQLTTMKILQMHQQQEFAHTLQSKYLD